MLVSLPMCNQLKPKMLDCPVNAYPEFNVPRRFRIDATTELADLLRSHGGTGQVEIPTVISGKYAA